MRELSIEKMEEIRGEGKVLCGLAIVGFGLATAAMFTTPVTASLGVALITSQSYVVAGVALSGCFADF